MSDTAPPARRFPRPLDLLALLGALFVATAAWSFLFRRTDPPRPVDPLLGAVVEARFDADLPWKTGFAPAGSTLRVEGILRAKVEAVDLPEPGGPGKRRIRFRILDRGGQDPYALTDLKWGILRGSVVVLQDETSLVNAEVVAVEPAKKP